jgi:hypothetical protein
MAKMIVSLRSIVGHLHPLNSLSGVIAFICHRDLKTGLIKE